MGYRVRYCFKKRVFEERMIEKFLKVKDVNL